MASAELPKVLFLCTGNACRSQMAEGWARSLRGLEFQAFSAGTHPKTLDQRAVSVMAEAGIDISKQVAKSIDALGLNSFALVATVCSSARENCPIFLGPSLRVHRDFDDPPMFARQAPSEEEALKHYRRVRDEIRAFVESLSV